MAKSTILYVLALSPLTVMATDVDPALVHTKAYVCDYEQISTLYTDDAPPLTDKNECDLSGKQFFVVVEVLNTSNVGVQGDLSVIYKGTEDFPFASDVPLAPNMVKPDYFIWPIHGGKHNRNACKPPTLATHWKNLHIYEKANLK